MKIIDNNTFRPAARFFGIATLAVLFSLSALSTQPVLAHHAGVDSGGIYFGDDWSEWAFDGECDDPRFFGPGTAYELYLEDAFHDATDCYHAYNRGYIWLR